jgi:hypothetical protein
MDFKLEAKAKAEEIYLYFDQFPNLSKKEVRLMSLFVAGQVFDESAEHNTTLKGMDRDAFWTEVKIQLERK